MAGFGNSRNRRSCSSIILIGWILLILDGSGECIRSGSEENINRKTQAVGPQSKTIQFQLKCNIK